MEPDHRARPVYIDRNPHNRGFFWTMMAIVEALVGVSSIVQGVPGIGVGICFLAMAALTLYVVKRTRL